MAVLASRKHYCTNARVRNGNNLDEECKLLLEDKEAGCPQFKNWHRVKHHPSVQKGGCHEAHDIEDLVQVGKMVKGCSYFAARSLADDAYIVFCPYSYIINPTVRRAMEVDIKGAVLILDEAHNIEDLSREAGSVNVDDEALHRLQLELGQLIGFDTSTYEPLHEMVQNLISWMELRKNSLEKREFQHSFSCWTGDRALRELDVAHISPQCFPILHECAAKAIKAASDAELEAVHLSGMSAITLEGLFSSLSYFFHDNGRHIHDYQLVMQRFIKRDAANSSGVWTHSFGLWCLNPGVVFRSIADLSMSVILTSGTLSPMNSFSSELGVPFDTLLEAPHVIDVDSQVWASVISTDPHNYPLNASYKTSDVYAFQDALGGSLEEIFKVVPGGTLVFFPSYKLMEKLCRRWHETGQWSRMNSRKTLFIEPRGGSQEDFDAVLKGYYSSINKGSIPAIGKRRKAKKVDDNDLTATDSLNATKDGAAFLAVCRGKVSEGIDFSDDNARTVILVGIPFPSMNDIQILEKKKYNDTYKHSKNLLSGSDWYCQQAFRALNQAAGRCIRHRFDYGAIILLDERFREERNTIYISKWLRRSIRTSDNLMKSVEELRSFFRNAKERVDSAKNVQDSISDVENIPPNDSGQLSVKRKGKKLGVPRLGAKRNVVDNMKHSSVPLNSLSFQDDSLSGDMTSRTQSNVEFLDSSPKYLSNLEIPRGTAGISHNANEVLRCGVPLSTSFDDEVMEITVVKETPPTINAASTRATPDSSMDNDNSRSTLIQTSEFGQENFMFSSLDHQDITPERNSLVTGCCMPLTDSSTNLSVNSHANKRRMSLNSLLINSIQGKKLNMASGEVTDNFKVRSSDLNHITKIAPSKEISSECDNQRTMPSPSTLNLNQQSQIFCSLCKSSLSPETNPYVICCVTSLSKAIFGSFSEGKEQLSGGALSPARVVIVDASSIDKRVCGDPGNRGVWCQEDGCVYNSMFCPFCVSRKHCLGFQILATDASNFQLINKILFYYDRLEVKTNTELEKKVNGDIRSRQVIDVEATTSAELRKAWEDNGSCGDVGVGVHSIEKFAYQSPKQSSGGWRTTKPKSKLVKGKGSHSSQC